MDVIIHNDGWMYVAVHDLWFRVIALVVKVSDANAFLKKHPDCGVLAEEGRVIIIADNADEGKLL